jgi:HEAT repeat protein
MHVRQCAGLLLILLLGGCKPPWPFPPPWNLHARVSSARCTSLDTVELTAFHTSADQHASEAQWENHPSRSLDSKGRPGFGGIRVGTMRIRVTRPDGSHLVLYSDGMTEAATSGGYQEHPYTEEPIPIRVGRFYNVPGMYRFEVSAVSMLADVYIIPRKARCQLEVVTDGMMSRAASDRTGPAMDYLVRQTQSSNSGPRGRDYYREKLRKLGGPTGDAIEFFSAILKDDDLRCVHSDAADALGSIGPRAGSAVDELLRATERREVNAIWALGMIGPGASRAVPRLVELLQDERFWLHHPARIALIRIGEASVRSLERLLAEADGEVGRRAATALVELAATDDRIVPDLAQLLASQSADVRESAAWAMAQIQPGNSDHLPSLRTALQDKSSKVRGYTARAIGMLGARGREAEVDLDALRRSEDDTSSVYAYAIWALVRIRGDN